MCQLLAYFDGGVQSSNYSPGKLENDRKQQLQMARSLSECQSRVRQYFGSVVVVVSVDAKVVCL